MSDEIAPRAGVDGGDSTAQAARSKTGRGGRGERAMVPPAEPRSYYGQPVLKEPVWTPEIPLYFFFGGLAGGSAMLACAAELAGNERLARSAWAGALVGIGASPPLLISDLGRPERFLNMLRMFKLTSPMSVGSWILAASGPAIALGAARSLLGRFERVGMAGGAAAALLGGPLASYTGVLVANTAVPAWHEARYELPFLFEGGALASAGAAATVVTPARRAAPARRLTVIGAAIELIAAQVMERRLGELAEPYHEGAAGRFSKLAQTLTATGAAIVGLRGRDRRAAVVGGALTLAGAMSERWAVYRAGFQSARDPKYTVAPQRRRLEERSESG